MGRCKQWHTLATPQHVTKWCACGSTFLCAKASSTSFSGAGSSSFALFGTYVSNPTSSGAGSAGGRYGRSACRSKVTARSAEREKHATSLGWLNLGKAPQ